MSIYCEDCVLPNDGEDLRESIQHTDLGAFAALKKKKNNKDARCEGTIPTIRSSEGWDTRVTGSFRS